LVKRVECEILSWERNILWKGNLHKFILVDGYLTWQLSFAGFLNIPVFVDARIIIEFLHICSDVSDIFKQAKNDPSLLVGLEGWSEGVVYLFVPKLELNWYSLDGLSSFIQCENYISEGLVLLQV